MSGALFRDFRIVDCGKDLRGDVLVLDGKIARIGRELPAEGNNKIIEGRGRMLLPSFVDLHAHFRDPGLTHKEDVESGCRAAAHGGYTAVNLMANTRPVCSSMEMVRDIRARAARSGLCDVHQTVSITEGFDGETLSHLDALDGSVCWLSDDGFGVKDTGVMLRAMNIAKEKGFGVMLHEEDAALTKIDTYLAEELMTFRDLQLARLTGCRTHFCHVSTINAMLYIMNAKRECPRITCEVTPHHLYLNDKNPGRCAPPLRAEEHRQFLIHCVKNGHVDAIATDHAPHTAQEKLEGANGFTGLDLSFAACYTALVRPGHIAPGELSRLLSWNPAQLLGVAGGKIEPGFPANLVVADTEQPFVADEAHIYSRSKNTPLLGETLWGAVQMTMKEGVVTYEQAD